MALGIAWTGFFEALYYVGLEFRRKLVVEKCPAVK